MKKKFFLFAFFYTSVFAQNAAVSSYLDPRTNGNSDIRIREVRIPTSGHTISTYWCTLGYRTTGKTTGYGGLQWTTDNSVGPKNYIYSQWNDYTKCPFHDPSTKVTIFGGEGTGVKSINNDPLNQWEPGYWHVTADRVWDEGDSTYFAYIVKNGKNGIWRHIITWSTPEKGLRFKGSYCFIEDWTGSGSYRESNIRRGWNHLSTSQSWQAITTYNYSINSNDIAPGGRSYNKRTNWCGGKKQDSTGEYFYMGAGGNVACTNNNGTNYTIPHTEVSPQEEYGVIRISNLEATPINDNSELVIKWHNDSTTVPQFAYYITVKDVNSKIISKSDTIPQKRSDTLNISALILDKKSYTLTLNLLDMFNGKAEPLSINLGNGVSVKSELTSGQSLKNIVVRASGSSMIFSRNFKIPVELSLYDTNGRLIHKGKIIGCTHKLNKTLSNGSYFWRMSNGTITNSGKFALYR